MDGRQTLPYGRVARHPPLDVPLRMGVKYPHPCPAYQLLPQLKRRRRRCPTSEKKPNSLGVVEVPADSTGTIRRNVRSRLNTAIHGVRDKRVPRAACEQAAEEVATSCNLHREFTLFPHRGRSDLLM